MNLNVSTGRLVCGHVRGEFVCIHDVVNFACEQILQDRNYRSHTCAHFSVILVLNARCHLRDLQRTEPSNPRSLAGHGPTVDNDCRCLEPICCTPLFHATFETLPRLAHCDRVRVHLGSHKVGSECVCV